MKRNMIITQKMTFSPINLLMGHQYVKAYISKTTQSRDKKFSGKLIQYIYISKMDLSENSQKSHLAPFFQSRSHIISNKFSSEQYFVAHCPIV